MNKPNELPQLQECRRCFAYRMAGDGCSVCNPQLAAEYERDAIAEAQALRPDEETAEDLG